MCGPIVQSAGASQPWQPPVIPPPAPAQPESWQSPVYASPTPNAYGAGAEPPPAIPPGSIDPSYAGATTPPMAPPTAAAPRAPWLRRNLGLVAAGAGVLGLATVGALAVALVLKPAASVGKLIPSSADVYVSVALDPSVTQKMNLVNLVHKFPDFKSDADITRQLNDAFKGEDLSFTNDVQPWLGPE